MSMMVNGYIIQGTVEVLEKIVIQLAQVSGQDRSQEDKDQEQFLQKWNQR